MSVAKRRAIDRFRHREVQDRIHEQLARDRLRALSEDDSESADIGDDVLRLIFIACHPVLSMEGRVALTLRLLGGLATPEIARAFLVSEATVAQRIVRAKRTLSEAHVAFEEPDEAERSSRLGAVLEVIYLIFNEGYSASAGDDVVRPELCEDALRLGRLLAELAPAEPEVHALVALMELQASRTKARVDASGDPILLMEQDRGRWDHLLIRRGLAALDRSSRLSGSLGPYALQAAIAAEHAVARTPEETDWVRIAALYDALAELHPTPVVRLNRAVAISRAYGPQAGLHLVEALAFEPALRTYHLLPSVQGDLLEQLARFNEAKAAYERAASLAQNARDRAALQAAATRCARLSLERKTLKG